MSIPHAILSVLADGPLHGYAVRSRLRARLGFLWPVNHGQVYATLARLASDGAVAVREGEPPGGRRGDGPGRTYERSASGERRLAEWCARPVPSVGAGGEIREKIDAALAIGDAGVVDAFLARQVASCATLLEACRHEARGRTASAAPERRLLDRAALRLLEADLAWLSSVRAACATLRG